MGMTPSLMPSFTAYPYDLSVTGMVRFIRILMDKAAEGIVLPQCATVWAWSGRAGGTPAGTTRREEKALRR